MNPKDLDNSVLLRASRGDEGAFEQLLFSIERLIYNIALRMMGNPAEAEDAAQESILKIYKNIKKCTDIKHFKNWACVITNNTCIDELRKRKNRNYISLDALADPEGDEVPISLPSDEPSPPEVLLRLESRDAVLAALEMLPPLMKSIIVLRDIEGLSYQDLAIILEVAEGTVKSRLNRARLALRKILSAEEQTET